MKCPKKPLEINNVVVQIEPGTEHTIISELPRAMVTPTEIEWKTLESQDLEAMQELVFSLLERNTPQRITIPAMQIFADSTPVDQVLGTIDSIFEMVRGSMHVVTFPTLRFIPSAYPTWESVARINAHIMQRSIEFATPILLLHKSFMSRQKGEWVVCPTVYKEYCAGHGLGSELTPNGAYRYAQRLIRFHGAFHRVEAPCQQSAPVVPLDLWRTWTYTETPLMAEILTEMGHVLERPKRKGGRAKGKVFKRQKAANGGVQQAGNGQVNPSCSKDNVLTYAAPSPMSIISIDEGTFKKVFRENCQLRQDLKLLKVGLDDTEKYASRLRADLKVAECERARYKHESRAASRRFRKLDEESFRDLEDWKTERCRLQKEIDELTWEVQEYSRENKELKDRVKQEQEKTRVLKMQMDVWEEWCKKKGGDMEEKRKQKKYNN